MSPDKVDKALAKPNTDAEDRDEERDLVVYEEKEDDETLEKSDDEKEHNSEEEDNKVQVGDIVWGLWYGKRAPAKVTYIRCIACHFL